MRSDEVNDLSPHLSCAACAEILHRHVEGETDPFTAGVVRRHLADCDACASEARHLEAERIALLEAVLRSPALSGHFPSRVVGRIAALERARKAQKMVRRTAAALAVAAAVAVAAGAGFYFSTAGPPASTNLADGNRSAPAECVESPMLPDNPAPASATELAPIVDAPRDRPKAVAQAASQVVASARRWNVADTIEFSACLLPREAPPPCQRDVNDDGLTDLRDAAHLFMLTIASTGDAPFRPSADDVEDCEVECLMPRKI